jgi:hypothetical protein
LYLLLFCETRVMLAIRRGTLTREPLRRASAGVLLTLLAPLVLLAQPALAMGDPTWASWVLARATLLLPVAVLASVPDLVRPEGMTLWRVVDLAVVACVLQWCAVLGWWQLLPLAL